MECFVPRLFPFQNATTILACAMICSFRVTSRGFGLFRPVWEIPAQTDETAAIVIGSFRPVSVACVALVLPSAVAATSSRNGGVGRSSGRRCTYVRSVKPEFLAAPDGQRETDPLPTDGAVIGP